MPEPASLADLHHDDLMKNAEYAKTYRDLRALILAWRDAPTPEITRQIAALTRHWNAMLVAYHQAREAAQAGSGRSTTEIVNDLKAV